MNKKILVGSIVSVAILILVSFSGVVGFQSVKSSTIAKASPLFSIRSKRAIDEESKDIACDYVGKGKTTLITIPKRDDSRALQQKFIDMIIKMDDKTFNRFMDLVINHMKQNGYTDIDNGKIINKLNQLRTNQEIKGIPLANSDNPRFDTVFQNLSFLNWCPGCGLIYLLILISIPLGILAAISESVMVFLLVFFTLLAPFCRTAFCPPPPG